MGLIANHIRDNEANRIASRVFASKFRYVTSAENYEIRQKKLNGFYWKLYVLWNPNLTSFLGTWFRNALSIS